MRFFQCGKGTIKGEAKGSPGGSPCAPERTFQRRQGCCQHCGRGCAGKALAIFYLKITASDNVNQAGAFHEERHFPMPYITVSGQARNATGTISSQPCCLRIGQVFSVSSKSPHRAVIPSCPLIISEGVFLKFTCKNL